MPTILHAEFYHKKFGDISYRSIVVAIFMAANINFTSKGQVVPIYVMKALDEVSGEFDASAALPQRKELPVTIEQEVWCSPGLG
jgi:hypothetical protein